MTILPLTYLGGIEWFMRLAETGRVIDAGGGNAHGGYIIDIGENWVKQTARNRAEILTAGGPTALTVPVHGYGRKIQTKDIRIDNSKRWQHTHWMSIVSAYRASPFFDHYEERFEPVYARKFDFLTDLNLELLDILASALKLDVVIEISENYIVPSPGDIDLRGKKALRRAEDPVDASGCQGRSNQPSQSDPGRLDQCQSGRRPCFRRYTQVFSDRMPFVPGLSIADLLFCEGPSARGLLLPDTLIVARWFAVAESRSALPLFSASS